MMRTIPIAMNRSERTRFTTSMSSPRGLGADHHPAVGVAKDVVDHPAEHALAPALALLGAEHDYLRAPPPGLVDDRLADVAGAHDARDHGHAVLAAECGGLAQLVLRLPHGVVHGRGQREVHRH